MNKTPPWPDPIITELHATREHLAAQYNNDLVAYSHAAEAHCRALGFRTVDSTQPRVEKVVSTGS
ncbi:hypothetical protein [Methylovulum psychrotolerans]|uniref:hypothetical protein n=1 Tax=Methylovulum psychrotolerans TaxID=1704499 RepID=UPI0012F7DE8B|nr:hypothetical protein [Methylovulum psychrotolerans]